METNVTRVLPEALPAEVEVVLADQTGLVSADTAEKIKIENLKNQYFLKCRSTLNFNNPLIRMNAHVQQNAAKWWWQ